MNQREVTDKDNTKWTCVQAFAALDGKAAAIAEQRSETNDGKVPVVCTPSGGAQSVRVALDKNWEQLPDEELLAAIEANRS